MIHQFSVLIEKDLLVILLGKSRKICLKSLGSILDPNQITLNCEIDELKSVHLFALDPIKLLLCVAMKNRLLLYQLLSQGRPLHYECLTDLPLAQSIEYLEFFSWKPPRAEPEQRFLCYGYASIFFTQRLDQKRASEVLLRDGELLSREERSTILRLVSLSSMSRGSAMPVFL